jgi:hypothetical protein
MMDDYTCLMSVRLRCPFSIQKQWSGSTWSIAASIELRGGRPKLGSKDSIRRDLQRTFPIQTDGTLARRGMDTPLRRGMAHLPIPVIARTIRAVKQNY